MEQAKKCKNTLISNDEGLRSQEEIKSDTIRWCCVCNAEKSHTAGKELRPPLGTILAVEYLRFCLSMDPSSCSLHAAGCGGDCVHSSSAGSTMSQGREGQ